MWESQSAAFENPVDIMMLCCVAIDILVLGLAVSDLLSIFVELSSDDSICSVK